MEKNYTEGIAFILEGATEKVFYKALLEFLSHSDEGIVFYKGKSDDASEIIFCWQIGDRNILIKFYVVGTITQMVHSGKWFQNMCHKKHKCPWTVYLCYDTDSVNASISKFYEGDWKALRQEIEALKETQIIDLAASADIEDIILLDYKGVLNFLGLPSHTEVTGRKGKAKMKALHRLIGRAYHEGERAEGMIRALNFDKIVNDAPIQLELLKNQLLN